MADSRKTGGSGRQMINAAVQAGGLVVASSLLAGPVQAKDADKKAATKSKDAGSAMAVKQVPNTVADKPQPGGTMAWKLAPNSKAAKVNPPKGS